MKKLILDILFPIHCLGCGKEKEFICSACLSKIPINNKLHVAEHLDKLLITSDYNNYLIKTIIHKYKYEFVKDLSFPLGQLMVKKLLLSNIIAGESLNKHNNSADNILLMPIPLHKRRLKWRGFNQSELLAQEISKNLNIPLLTNILIRHRYNKPQMTISRAQQRKENIRNIFCLSPSITPDTPDVFSVIASDQQETKQFYAPVIPASSSVIPVKTGIQNKKINFQNKTIILIDDISTTGATLSECAKTLKPIQPKNIWGLVLAQG